MTRKPAAAGRRVSLGSRATPPSLPGNTVPSGIPVHAAEPPRATATRQPRPSSPGTAAEPQPPGGLPARAALAGAVRRCSRRRPAPLPASHLPARPSWRVSRTLLLLPPAKSRASSPPRGRCSRDRRRAGRRAGWGRRRGSRRARAPWQAGGGSRWRRAGMSLRPARRWWRWRRRRAGSPWLPPAMAGSAPRGPELCCSRRWEAAAMRKGRSRGDKAVAPPPPPRREPGRAVAASTAERRATLLGGGGRKEPEDARAAGAPCREALERVKPGRGAGGGEPCRPGGGRWHGDARPAWRGTALRARLGGGCRSRGAGVRRARRGLRERPEGSGGPEVGARCGEVLRSAGGLGPGAAACGGACRDCVLLRASSHVRRGSAGRCPQKREGWMWWSRREWWCVSVLTAWRWVSGGESSRCPQSCLPACEEAKEDAVESSLCYVLAGISNYRMLLASNLL